MTIFMSFSFNLFHEGKTSLQVFVCVDSRACISCVYSNHRDL